MNFIAKRVVAAAFVAIAGLLCVAGPGMAQKAPLSPEIQGHVDMVLVVENADNALELISALIKDNPAYAVEIATAAAKLRPELAGEFMALLTTTAPTNAAPTNAAPTNAGLPECGPSCLPEQGGPAQPVALSATLLETMENPSVVSQSQ